MLDATIRFSCAFGGNMRTSIMGRYATLALFSISFIALSNCGSQQDSSGDEAYDAQPNGSASDYVIIGMPPAGYPVAPGVPVPAHSIETGYSDGVDNDGNGLVDCMDPACQYRAECSEWG